jgi:hypothetical protein
VLKRCALVGAVALAVSAGDAAAQGVGSGLDVERIAPRVENAQRIWPVKFLCGTIAPDPAEPERPASPADPLAPGTYLSAINVTTTVSLLGLELRVAEAKPLGAPVGATGKVNLPALLEGTAVEIDCKQITDLLFPPRGGTPAPSFVKGFAHLVHSGSGPGAEPSRAKSVDVVAVYSSNRTAVP